MPLAKAAASQAVLLEETSGEEHASLAHVMFAFDWTWRDAEREFKRTLELNPNYATGHQWYGHLLLTEGRFPEAFAEFTRAVELDPLSLPCNLAMGYWHYCARNPDKAIEQYRKVLELAPNTPFALYELSLTYQQKHCCDEALAIAEQAAALTGGQAASLALLARAKALAGRKSEAYFDLERLQQLSEHRYVPAIYIAGVYASLDDKDQSFAWLERAYEDRSNYTVFLGVEPSFDSLRSDSRYADLLGRIGLDISKP